MTQFGEELPLFVSDFDLKETLRQVDQKRLRPRRTRQPTIFIRLRRAEE